jgi:transcriptional regulator with XRE-family HTH domain
MPSAAGISFIRYTQLEQGKEITPSGAALARIADVLRLVPAERAYPFAKPGESTRTMHKTLGMKSFIGRQELFKEATPRRAYLSRQAMLCRWIKHCDGPENSNTDPLTNR